MTECVSDTVLCTLCTFSGLKLVLPYGIGIIILSLQNRGVAY